jgi:polyferredoxin
VYEHLAEYLNRARGLAEQREHLIEVCVLCVQCMEVYPDKLFSFTYRNEIDYKHSIMLIIL